MGETGDPRTREILAAAVEVHRELGPGMVEALYEAALCWEFQERGVPFERQKEVPIIYKGTELTRYRMDLVVRGEVIVEIKSAPGNEDRWLAQMLTYLKCTSLRTGLIVNFGLTRLVDGVRRVSL